MGYRQLSLFDDVRFKEGFYEKDICVQWMAQMLHNPHAVGEPPCCQHRPQDCIPFLSVLRQGGVINVPVRLPSHMFPDQGEHCLLKRAMYFITCKGKMMYPTKMEEDYITRNLLNVKAQERRPLVRPRRKRLIFIHMDERRVEHSLQRELLIQRLGHLYRVYPCEGHSGSE